MKFKLSVRRGDFFLCESVNDSDTTLLLFHSAVERRIEKSRRKRQYSRIFTILEAIGQGRDRGRAHIKKCFSKIPADEPARYQISQSNELSILATHDRHRFDFNIFSDEQRNMDRQHSYLVRTEG